MKKIITMFLFTIATVIMVAFTDVYAVVPVIDELETTLTITATNTTSTSGADIYAFIEDNLSETYALNDIIKGIKVESDAVDFTSAYIQKTGADVYHIRIIDASGQFIIRVESDGYLDLTETINTFNPGTFHLKLTSFRYGEDVAYEDLFYNQETFTFTLSVEEGEGIFVDTTATELFDFLEVNGGWVEDEFFSNMYIANNVLSYTINDVETITHKYIYRYVQPDNNNDTYYNIGWYGDEDPIVTNNLTYIFEFDYAGNLGIEGGDVIIPDGTYEFTITFRSNLPWTKSHDYGRIRTESDTNYFLNHITTGTGAAHFSTVNGSVGFNHTQLKRNEIVTLQSPYQNFRVSYGTAGNPVTNLVAVDNVAAVMMYNWGYEENYDFIVYHWVDDAIEISSFLNVDLDRTGLQIKFTGGLRQAISGNAAIIGNVDDLNDISYYTNLLTAWDDIDGDISDSIYVINDGNYDGSVVGTYTVEVGVTDSEGQESRFIFSAIVADNVAPTLVAPNLNQTVAYNANFNFTTYLASLVKTDNYYAPEDITITIYTNQYTGNKTTPGTYNVVLRVQDPYVNFTDYTLTITVTDPVAPVFTGGINTLSKSVNEVITLAQILATQVATDAVDGNVSSSIAVVSDNYSGYETTPGDYEIVIRAQDSSGNSVLKTITINVFSGVPGWYLPDDGPIIIPDGSTLTFDQIKIVLASVGFVGPTSDVVLVSSNYFGNEDKPGTYQLNVTVDGNPVTYNLLVLNQGDGWFPDVPNPPLAAQPNITLIIASVVAAVALVGTVLFIITKKRKA